MNFLRLLPVFLSILVLAAHFFRAGRIGLVALCLLLPFSLLYRSRWSARAVQVCLLLGALVWIRTLILLVGLRQTHGQPWMRMAIILGVVALLTGLSSLVFRSKSLKERYSISTPPRERPSGEPPSDDSASKAPLSMSQGTAKDSSQSDDSTSKAPPSMSQGTAKDSSQSDDSASKAPPLHE